ncbi:hypothetical protein F4804DRAFT_345840 [Jackrogersella minutella]|nr:hypothetical protein F4804DRAFT_345840 [Jackrogersella minutella]
MYNRAGRNNKSIPWVEGMRLGQGARHNDDFRRRVLEAPRETGSGTVYDPSVIWLEPGPSHRRTEEALRATEAIVAQETRRRGLSHAFIAAEGHSFSTAGRSANGDRIMSLDDNHVTLRMGSSRFTSNVQGHLYLRYKDDDPRKEAIRMMTNDERSVVGGQNPHLWVCGRYPPESREWPRARVKYPETPFEIVPNSVLDKFQEEMHEIEQKKIKDRGRRRNRFA